MARSGRFPEDDPWTGDDESDFDQRYVNGKGEHIFPDQFEDDTTRRRRREIPHRPKVSKSRIAPATPIEERAALIVDQFGKDMFAVALANVEQLEDHAGGCTCWQCMRHTAQQYNEWSKWIADEKEQKTFPVIKLAPDKHFIHSSAPAKFPKRND